MSTRTATRRKKLLDFIPSHRLNDVVYFNRLDFPSQSASISLDGRRRQKHLVRDGLMGGLQEDLAGRLERPHGYIMQNTVQALLDYPGATLLGINRMLVDADYRKARRDVHQGSGCEDVLGS